MTHLVIQLKTALEGGSAETVSSRLIKLLYDEANDPNLVYLSTDLKGDLVVNATYQDYITFLTTRYPGLNISATSIYLRFADSTMESLWANSTYGDGIGISAASAALVTSIPYSVSSQTKNNTSITSFNELSSFGITALENELFSGCTNLTSIDLRNITRLGRSVFAGCSSLAHHNWDLSHITQMGQFEFNGCSSLTGTLDLSGVTTFDGIPNLAFANCSGLTKIILGTIPTIGSFRTNANRSTFYNCTALKVIDIALLNKIIYSNNKLLNTGDVFKAIIIRNSSTVPVVEPDDNITSALSASWFTNSTVAKMYVPRAMLSAYAADSGWSGVYNAGFILALEDYVES